MKSIKKAAIIAGASSENYMFIAVLIESSHLKFMKNLSVLTSMVNWNFKSKIPMKTTYVEF